MLNDIVILTNITESDRGRSGEVKEIVEQGSRYTTGTLVYNEGYWEFAADIPIRYKSASQPQYAQRRTDWR